MIINICMGTQDLTRGTAFYDTLAAELGLVRYMETAKAIGWRNSTLGIGLAITLPLPYNGNPATAGNGTMASIGAAYCAQANKIHPLALAHGGTGEGAPGQRPNGFYAAYFRDPDSNKLNAVALG
jgi:predicted lactoylglutathione lyase